MGIKVVLNPAKEEVTAAVERAIYSLETELYNAKLDVPYVDDVADAAVTELKKAMNSNNYGRYSESARHIDNAIFQMSNIISQLLQPEFPNSDLQSEADKLNRKISILRITSYNLKTVDVSQSIPLKNADLQGYPHDIDEDLQDAELKMRMVNGVYGTTFVKNEADIKDRENTLKVLENDLLIETDPTIQAEIQATIDSLEAAPDEEEPSIFVKKVETETGFEMDEVSKTVSRTLGDFRIITSGIDGAINDAIDGAADVLGPVVDTAGTIGSILDGTSKNNPCSGLNLSKIAGRLEGVFGGAANLIDKGIGEITSVTENVLSGIGKVINDPIGNLKKAGGKIVQGISGTANLVGKAGSLLADGLGDIADGVGDFLDDPTKALGNIVSGIGDAMGNLPNILKTCGMSTTRCLSSNFGGLFSRFNGVRFPHYYTPCGRTVSGLFKKFTKRYRKSNNFLNAAEKVLNTNMIGAAKGILDIFDGDTGITKTVDEIIPVINENIKEEASSALFLHTSLTSEGVDNLLNGMMNSSETETKDEQKDRLKETFSNVGDWV